MTNSIVGQSRDRVKQIENQKKSKGLQLEMNRLFQEQLDSHEDRLGNLEDTMRVNGVQEMKITNAVNRTVERLLFLFPYLIYISIGILYKKGGDK